jgi:chromosome segregation ATPase
MSDVPFKNLASAREQYFQLSEEFAAAKEKLEQFETLLAENGDLKTRLEIALKSVADGNAQIAFRDEVLSTKDQTISARDNEIKELKAGLEVLKVKCTDLERTQKSVKAQARELVAASAGPPAPVDNSEMEMTQDDLARAMLKETDKTKLNALYRQFKSQQVGKQ